MSAIATTRPTRNYEELKQYVLDHTLPERKGGFEKDFRLSTGPLPTTMPRKSSQE